MIANSIEPLRSLRELLAEHGLNPSGPTLWRWLKRGSRGAVLKHARVGNRLMSRPSWVAEFVEALTIETPTACPAAASPVKLEQRHRRALAALAKA